MDRPTHYLYSPAYPILQLPHDVTPGARIQVKEPGGEWGSKTYTAGNVAWWGRPVGTMYRKVTEGWYDIACDTFRTRPDSDWHRLQPGYDVSAIVYDDTHVIKPAGWRTPPIIASPPAETLHDRVAIAAIEGMFSWYAGIPGAVPDHEQVITAAFGIADAYMRIRAQRKETT